MMRSVKLNSVTALVFFACITALVGCGAKGDFPTAYVDGTINKADGTPIQSGKIKFAPVSSDSESKSGKAAYGRIKDGKFELTTYSDGDGAVVGTHTVYLSEARARDGNVKHNCELAPESKTIEIVEGSNEITLVAVPKPMPQRRRANYDDDDDEDDD